MQDNITEISSTTTNRTLGDDIIVIDNLYKIFGNVMAVCGFSPVSYTHLTLPTSDLV